MNVRLLNKTFQISRICVICFVAFVVTLSLFSYKQLPQNSTIKDEYLQMQDYNIDRLEGMKNKPQYETKAEIYYNGVTSQTGNLFKTFSFIIYL